MSDQLLRHELCKLLSVQQAHMNFEDAVQDFPIEHMNTIPTGLEYSFWHLLEHIRICQVDILEYIRNPHYQYPNFPQDYWPSRDTKTDITGWQATVKAFIEDRQALIDIVQDPQNDLYAQIPHGATGHNILREILVVADHNAYHIGELAILRQVMGLW